MGKTRRSEHSPSKGHRALQSEEQDTGIEWDTGRETSEWLDGWSHGDAGRRGHQEVCRSYIMWGGVGH